MKGGGQWKERHIAGTYISEVYELEGHVPPAVIKYVNGGSEERVELYQKECDILKTLNHRNIVVLYGTRVVPNSQRLGIIMEYCSKGSLKSAIADPKLIYTMKTVLVWAEQLFDALDYMYREHNVVHRDIKPDNIFITLEYSLKIGDFGLTTIAEQTRSGSHAGTDRYMSPLQNVESTDESQSPKVSHRNDIYSLGLVLWELWERKIVLQEYGSLYGFIRDHFVADVMNKKFNAIKPTTGPLAEIVAKCTNFDRLLRPDASTVLQTLQEINQNSNFHDWTPEIRERQKKLLRPIGFDGTTNEVEVLLYGTTESLSLPGVDMSNTSTFAIVLEHDSNNWLASTPLQLNPNEKENEDDYSIENITFTPTRETTMDRSIALEFIDSIKNLFWSHGSHTGYFCPGKNHIANQADFDVFIIIGGSESIVTNRQVAFEKAKTGYSGTRPIAQIAQSIGLNLVKSTHVECFRPGHSETKYLTVYSAAGGKLCNCKEIGCNDSVLVEEDGYVCLSKMGSVWERRTGK